MFSFHGPAMVGQIRKRFGASKSRRASVIGLNHRLRIVPDEEERVVQIAVSPRAHIRCIHSRARNLIAPRNLKLAVRIAAPVR